jgi:hypothetical protein
MPQPLICDNHPEDPRVAALILTQADSGEVLKLCADCWPMTFAGMLDALPSEERPTVPGTDDGAGTQPVAVAADDNGAGGEGNVVPMTRHKARGGSKTRTT